MADHLTSSRTASRRVTRHGPALKLSGFVAPPRPMIEQIYKPGGVFGDDELGTIYLLPTDGDSNFATVAAGVDIGLTRVEGLYLTIWLGNQYAGFETPTGAYVEVALLLSSDIGAETYDGWHEVDPNNPYLHWGLNVNDTFLPPQMAFAPGPRPSGNLFLGLRGHYVYSGLTLALREWRLTTVRLAL